MADKYYRLVCFVVNICPEPLREFFLKLAKSDPAVTAVYTDLGAYLIQRQPQIANLKTRKIIRQDQYDLIFPSAVIANISEWDVTLLVTLIKNLFVIKPLEEFLLEEMRKIRNDLQHIPNTSAISDGEFDGYWNRLKNAAKTLAREVSGPAYETEIGGKVTDIQCNNLPSLANTLRIFYDEVRKQLFSKIDSMEETIQSLEGNVIELKAKLDIVATNSAVSTSVLSSVTVTKFGPNGEKVKRIKAVDDILHRLVKQLQSTMQTELQENFTPPREIVDIEAKLNDTHHVIVTGARNTPYLETALYVIKNRVYNLQRCVEMNDASDWRHIDPEEVDFVLLKDPFGSYCYDDTKAKSMLNIFDSIYLAVQPKQGQKTLDVILVSDFDYLAEVNGFKEHELLNEVVKMFEPTSASAPVEITTVAPTSIATSSNHFLRQMTDIFLRHFSEDSKRVDKNIVKAAKEKLKKNKMLVITGPPESGKTSLAVELAKSYAKKEVLLFSSPDKIETIDFRGTSLVIIDDFVGKYGFQRNKVIEWFLRFDQLYLVVAAGKLNIIVTCETSQLNKCNNKINRHRLLSFPLALTKLSTTNIKRESTGDPVVTTLTTRNRITHETTVSPKLAENHEVKDKDERVAQNPLLLQPRDFPLFGAENFLKGITDRGPASMSASENKRFVTSMSRIIVRSDDFELPGFINGFCMLPGSEILLIDHIHERLIKLDNTYKIVNVCYISTSNLSDDVCYVGDNAAVVCGNKKLVYVDIDRMSVRQEVNTNHSCERIACHKNTLYVMNYQNVFTYTVDFFMISRSYIRLNIDIPVNRTELREIVVGNDGNRIYLKTSDNDLITHDSLGNHLNTLKIYSTSGVCVDEKGYVWVGVLDDLYQVSADGARILNRVQRTSRILSDTISYDRNTSSIVNVEESEGLLIIFKHGLGD